MGGIISVALTVAWWQSLQSQNSRHAYERAQDVRTAQQNSKTHGGLPQRLRSERESLACNTSNFSQMPCRNSAESAQTFPVGGGVARGRALLEHAEEDFEQCFQRL